MYIVMIGWFYVISMVALASDSWLKGIVRLVFFGILPVVIWAYFTTRHHRRGAAAAQQTPAAETTPDETGKPE